MAPEKTCHTIVRKGAALIHEQGFNATGIQQVLDAAGIPKGSFYHYFQSKEDFGSAVIDYFATTTGELFNSYLNDKRHPPLTRLDNLFAHFEKELNKTGCALGCPLGNLALELADTNDKLREHLHEVIKNIILQLENCLIEAKQNKSITNGLNTHDTARFLFHAFEGAIMDTKVEKSIEPYKSFRRYVSAFIQ